MSGGGGNPVTPMPTIQPPMPMGGGMGGGDFQSQIQALLAGKAQHPMMQHPGGLIGSGAPQMQFPTNGLFGPLSQLLQARMGGQ